MKAERIIMTAAALLLALVLYVQWAATRCESTLTTIGLPCPRAVTHPDGWCDVHQPLEAARIQALIESLKNGDHLK